MRVESERWPQLSVAGRCLHTADAACDNHHNPIPHTVCFSAVRSVTMDFLPLLAGVNSHWLVPD